MSKGNSKCQILNLDTRNRIEQIISSNFPNNKSLLDDLINDKVLEIKYSEKTYVRLARGNKDLKTKHITIGTIKPGRIIQKPTNTQEFVSVKPSNIALNFGKLFSSFIHIGASIVTIATEAPIFAKIFAALLILEDFDKSIKVKISENEVNVMIALWYKANKLHEITYIEGYKATNEFLEAKNLKAYDEEQFKKTIDNLVKIKSLNITNNTIKLIETVSKSLLERDK